MNINEPKMQVSDIPAEHTAKKIYSTPSIKVYGNINDLVKATGSGGSDGGETDDATGS